MTDTVTFTWTIPGPKVITVTANNELGTATSTHLITLVAADLPIYTDTLAGGWQDWSWNTTRSFDNTQPVHSGSASIAITYTAAWAGFYLTDTALPASDYTAIRFWVHGGSTGGQSVNFHLDDGESYPFTVQANTWLSVTVPFAALGNPITLSALIWQDGSGSDLGQPTFYLDDISLIGPTPPASVNLSGRTEGVTQIGYPFMATVDPMTTTVPITYTWQSTGQVPFIHTGDNLTDTVTFTWTIPGPKVITVTANNQWGTATSTHLITLAQPYTGTQLAVDTAVDSNELFYRACTAAANDCSLRGAISRANLDSGQAYTIQLPAGIYPLTLPGAGEDNNATGDLDLNGNLTVLGGGAKNTIIDGGQLDRVLHVQSNGTVAIHDVEITGGRVVGSGGGVYIAAGSHVEIADAAIHDNLAEGGTGGDAKGGGIYNAGTLDLKNTLVDANQAAGGTGSAGTSWYSGGLPGSAGGVGGNGLGGGVYNAGTLTELNVTVSGNSAEGGSGGHGGSGGMGNQGSAGLPGTPGMTLRIAPIHMFHATVVSGATAAGEAREEMGATAGMGETEVLAKGAASTIPGSFQVPFPRLPETKVWRGPAVREVQAGRVDGADLAD